MVTELVEFSTETAIRSFWLELENRSSPIFYLSWDWIGHWLQVFSIRGTLALVRDIDTREVVALGIFVLSEQKRHRGLLQSRQLILHGTGDDTFDAITIEHNGLLCLPGRESESWRSVVDSLKTRNNWDELVVPGASEITTAVLSRVVSNNIHREFVAPTYLVELENVTGLESYLGSLSKNTRAKIRRALKEYGSRGDIHLERAATLDQACSYVNEMAPHHRERWLEKSGKSVFDNQHFLRFHKQMMLDKFSTGMIEIIRISVGGKPIGWLYNIVRDGSVYFYLGAMVYEDNKYLKPGLVTHALTIADHAVRGSQSYDFLAGEAQYKASLGTTGLKVSNIFMQRSRVKFTIESVLRNIKNILKEQKGIGANKS